MDFDGTADIAPASTSPFALLCPDNIAIDAEPGQCGAFVRYPPFSNSIAVSHPSGSFFRVGATPVTATGVYGQSCSFKVTVRDRERPAIQCPANIDAFSDSGKTVATLKLPKPSASDNCDGVAVTGSRSDHQPLDAPYPIGDTVITWTARDAAGNATSCQQKINVKTRADLQVFQTIPPNSSLRAGELVTYKIKVVNIGPSPALGVVLTHQQSSNVKLVRVSGAGNCSDSRTITCNFETILPGAPAEIRITVKLLEVGGWLSNVSVNADPAFTVDPNPNNNLSTIRREIAP